MTTQKKEDSENAPGASMKDRYLTGEQTMAIVFAALSALVTISWIVARTMSGQICSDPPPILSASIVVTNAPAASSSSQQTKGTTPSAHPSSGSAPSHPSAAPSP